MGARSICARRGLWADAVHSLVSALSGFAPTAVTYRIPPYLCSALDAGFPFSLPPTHPPPTPPNPPPLPNPQPPPPPHPPPTPLFEPRNQQDCKTASSESQVEFNVEGLGLFFREVACVDKWQMARPRCLERPMAVLDFQAGEIEKLQPTNLKVCGFGFTYTGQVTRSFRVIGVSPAEGRFGSWFETLIAFAG